ncbi:hypothetical protein [Streptomyces sp. CRN 30]|uniref:hypothetical protein n=1 Tax=Streptomyces sp. CRN 30 TaxID=3075613 RepID=UPI002A811F95|nr:hypothetical protein [Streptomyces sp. CRN 30]
MSRPDAIARLLRRDQPTRTPLAYELRGSVVQFLAPGTTAPTWQATPELLAAAIDQALQKDTRDGAQPPAGGSTARAEILAVLQSAGYNAPAAAELLGRAFREPHATPADEFTETLAGGHALIVEHGDCEFHGSCQCGRRLGILRPDAPIDRLAGAWERHTLTELTELTASPIGAS